MSQISLQEFKGAFPDNLGKNASQQLVDKVNSILNNDPAFAEQYANNLFAYTNVLQNGKYKLSNYVEGVQFVSYLSMGLNNQDAYIKTFPQRYQHFLSKGLTTKEISAYISMYANSKLVSAIKEIAYIPVHIMYRHYFHDAVLTQAELMRTATSEKVRSDAATSLMNYLRPPEAKKVELDVTVKQDNTLTELRQTMEAFSAMQQQAIGSGAMSAKQIAAGRIINGEVEDV